MQTGSARACTGRRTAATAAALLTLSACAVDSPFAVSSTSNGTAARLAIAMAADERADPERSRLGDALRRAFADRSVRLADDGRYVAEYSLSWRDAEGGLTTSIDAVDAAAVAWQVRPRPRRMLDGCDAQRMRASLVLLDRQTGAMVYRGEGDSVGCRFDDQSVDQVAGALVSDALERLGG